MPAPTRIRLATRLKWRLFRTLERLSDLSGNSAAGHLVLKRPPTPQAALWVFVSTIGELNAIEPLLQALMARLPQLTPVLITDHPHYEASYRARYPAAEVCVTRGHGDDAATLGAHYPPAMLLVGEIPCWPADAPCRFSFAFLLEAKRRGAAAFLVNGWLYHYPPPCRMDAIERRLFQADYLRVFDAIGVQTDEIRRHLLAAGAPADRLGVTGNLKFDAMQRADWTPGAARSPQMLTALLAATRPVIVAGCVTDAGEQALVLDAFVQLRTRHADALLVLAPRHPEVAAVMQSIRDGLATRALTGRYRSALTDQAIEATTDCLVLDTIGELRDFYAAATIAHVGVDHNVLEPLAFAKPVTIRPGWEPTYPSYPVYQLLGRHAVLRETDDPARLATFWSELLGDPADYARRVQQIRDVLAAEQGATGRHLQLIAPWLGAD